MDLNLIGGPNFIFFYIVFSVPSSSRCQAFLQWHTRNKIWVISINFAKLHFYVFYLLFICFTLETCPLLVMINKDVYITTYIKQTIHSKSSQNFTKKIEINDRKRKKKQNLMIIFRRYNQASRGGEWQAIRDPKAPMGVRAVERGKSEKDKN